MKFFNRVFMTDTYRECIGSYGLAKESQQHHVLFKRFQNWTDRRHNLFEILDQ